jgi:hypothetical protein
MSRAAAGFGAAYARAFREFLEEGTESSLHAAYELGREAVGQELGLLDLAHAHHEVLLAELEASPEGEDPRRITSAAADFLLEAIAAFEMVRLGFAEAVEAVAFERRQAAMLRQLSTLLTDASLAVYGHSSIEEVLQLVVEQAHELTHGAWCLASVAGGPGDPTPIVAHTGSAPPALPDLAREAFAAVEVGTESSDLVPFETSHSEAGAVAVPLTALDGRAVGVLAVEPQAERRFTELDKAVIVHIAQMAAAAIERAGPYRRQGPRGFQR